MNTPISTEPPAPPQPEPQLRITDSTLRDGSHAMAHQFTEPQVRAIVHALDTSGVQVIEVSHGDGLGGSSFNYGFSREEEFGLIAAAVQEAKQAKIAVLPRSPGSPPTAPRRTSRSSTSGPPGRSGWRPSAS